MTESSFRAGPGPISVFEAESYVRSLECLSLEQVGSERWLQQHDYLEKLNLQAHYSALSGHDEYVVDAFILQDKIHILIHELLISEIWREKIFPLLVEEMDQLTSVKTYMVLYHEATLCNLLEILLYHQHITIHLDAHHDSMIEMIDYCIRRMQSLMMNKGYQQIWNPQEENIKNIEPSSVSDSLHRQCSDIAFSTASCAISILRFISDHLPHLSASLMLRLLQTHDVVLLLVPLIEESPYTRTRKNGKLEKFIDQKWVEIPPQDRLKLTKLEGQLWLTAYNLMMEPKCRQTYHINTHRKEIIMRLRRFLTDILLDQLPPLTSLKRALDELSIIQPPPPTASSLAIIEQIPEIRDELNKQDYTKIAAKQRATVFSSDPSARQFDIARLAATYDMDAYDEVLDDPRCAQCGDIAMKRCSRCHMEWYCSRPCQVTAWNNHKSICAMMCDKKKSKSISPSSQLATQDATSLLQSLNLNHQEDKENTNQSQNTKITTTTKKSMIEVLDD